MFRFPIIDVCIVVKTGKDVLINGGRGVWICNKSNSFSINLNILLTKNS